jgi:PEP-CTERM motif
MTFRASIMSGVAMVALVAASQIATAPASATPSLVEITAGAFTAGSGLITFSEPGFTLGTTNPTYNPADYGGGVGSPTVTFGGFFTGQSPGSSNPSACPTGAAVTGCVLGSPTGPLTLDPTSPATFIASDGAQPTTPVLSGTPTFNGSIAIEFSTPQAGVGLIGGFFNAVCSTGITAFDAAGDNLGSVCNSTTGDEFLGLVTSDGSADISGLLFHLVGSEPAGFDIDNVEFGASGQVTVPGTVPEPATLALLGGALSGLGLMRRRRRKT